MATQHVPILVKPILEALSEPFLVLPPNSQPHWIVDATLGGGGHTSHFLDFFASQPHLQQHKVLSLDQDRAAIEKARQRFKRELSEGRLEIVHAPFGSAEELIAERPVLGLLADLGFSSDQMGDLERGLSFQSEGPLDMRLNPEQGRSCAELLEDMDEPELERILREYGGEKFSRRIAQSLIRQRMSQQSPKTPKELSIAIIRALPPFARHGRIHAATRSFQALRMAVNDEVGQLDLLLNRVIPRLCVGGRVAILSFHSVEDRMVKLHFKSSPWLPLAKKPLQVDEEELAKNPRSRSAKLRVAVLQSK